MPTPLAASSADNSLLTVMASAAHEIDRHAIDGYGRIVPQVAMLDRDGRALVVLEAGRGIWRRPDGRFAWFLGTAQGAAATMALAALMASLARPIEPASPTQH